jgi:plasmid maintenance system antidote protein VapI
MKTFRNLIEQAKKSDAYWIEKAVLEFTSDIHLEMKNQNKNSADLAAIIGASPAYISKIFAGNANFTIKSMVKLARALDCRLHVKAVHETKKISISHFPRKMEQQKAVRSDVHINLEVGTYDKSIAA